MINNGSTPGVISVERRILASPKEVFDAWLDPKIPGSPFYENDKLIVDPKVDGLWYWQLNGLHHYGRFIDVTPPDRLQHSWMSRKTLGEETMVLVTFQARGEDTLLTLQHSGFSTPDMARAHENGWNTLLAKYAEIFANGARGR